MLTLLTLLVTTALQAQKHFVVTGVSGKAEYIDSGQRFSLTKGATLNLASKVYIPYNGSVTLLDETAGKEYTMKQVGWSDVEDLLNDKRNSVLSRTKDYVKAVVADLRKTPVVKALYVSDPATVTREKFKKPERSSGSFRDEFDAFKREARQEYDDFRKKALDEYAEFVRTAWQEYKGEKPREMPKQEEMPPIILADANEQTNSWLSRLFGKSKKKAKREKRRKNKEQVAVNYQDVVTTPPAPEQPQPLSEVKEDVDASNDYMVFTVFGTQYRVRIGDNCRFTLSSLNENVIADAITGFKKTQFDNMLFDCLQARREHHLSDWAYYQMLLALTNNFYGKGTSEGALTLAFLFSQSGYKTRLAHDGQQLHMLIASAHSIYRRSLWYIDGDYYYLLDGSTNETLRICRASFPKESPLSLRITAVQDFEENPTVERTITSTRNPDFSFTVRSNKNYMDFYETFPSSSVNDNFMTRWAIYANTPLEKGVTNQLYPKMREKLQGLSEREAVQQLLSWCQTGLVYGYDDEVWGYDRAFFGEETLFYPFCDCEDRAILFSHLVRDLVGRDVILVYWPGHLATAVNFSDDINGDNLTYEGRKFYICDPTYIPSYIGEMAESMSGLPATVILLDRN